MTKEIVTVQLVNYNDGWWHNGCFDIGTNYQTPYVVLNSKVYKPLSVEMKIRQRDCIIQ